MVLDMCLSTSLLKTRVRSRAGWSAKKKSGQGKGWGSGLVGNVFDSNDNNFNNVSKTSEQFKGNASPT